MCGRTVISLNQDCIGRLVGENVQWEGKEKYSPSFNVTPGKYQPIILPSKSGQRVITSMKWGLLVKTFPHQPCNARSETITTKKMFSRLLPTKKCVTICEGYYEWQTVIPGKQPYLIKPTNGPLFYFAGLFDTHTDSNGEVVYTYTIITTPSSSCLTNIHGRMPAILVGDEIDQWLNAKSIEESIKLVRPYQGELEIFPVSFAVGNSKNDNSDLVKEVEPKPEINPNPSLKLEKYFPVIHHNKKMKTEGGAVSINTIKNENNNIVIEINKTIIRGEKENEWARGNGPIVREGQK
jgi:putative SOS response-associated peptidase YedK